MTGQRYQTGLRRELHREAAIHEGLDGMHVWLPCVNCGPMQAFHMRGKLPPDVIRNKLLDQGWSFNGNRKAVCPKHKPARRERPVSETVETPVTSTEDKAAASDRAKRAKRDAIMLLDDVFDVAKGCYKPGENDESVGKVVGLSLQAVATIREEFYGPIKRPPELDALFAALENAQSRITQFRGETNRTLEAMVGEVTQLRARIEAVARRYQ